jgi:hypothetical protein
MLQILAGDRTPSWWPATDFITVSAVIPSNWVVKVGEGGKLDLAPESWLKPGFWDRYFDRDKDAILEFDPGPARGAAVAAMIPAGPPPTGMRSRRSNRRWIAGDPQRGDVR